MRIIAEAPDRPAAEKIIDEAQSVVEGDDPISRVAKSVTALLICNRVETKKGMETGPVSHHTP